MKSNGSMNRIYRLIWNATLRTWVVAAETARGRGKQSGTALTAAALSVAGAALLMATGSARAGPQGAQVVSGSAQVSQTGGAGQTITTVQQASAKLSLDWQSFNLGTAESIHFVQPSAAAIAVNRIADTQGSQILGRLTANGQVWLINPNGLLFGRDAQVNVGGLVASTLDLVAAADSGKRQRFVGSSGASVVNLGTIHAAEGGSVALLGHQVVNQGLISARLGSVAMAAGKAITLTFDANRLLGLQVDDHALNALADNGGVLRADGGQVLMSAGARDSLLLSVVNNSGVIEARTVAQQAGRIVLLGGKTAGSLTLAGTLDASAPATGNGGFIETSAAQVHIADSARLTTLAASGQTGRWLVDPTDFTVAAAGGDMTGAALSAALALNNVELSSEAGSHAGLGDININDAVSWSTNRNLTLTASNSVNVNANLTATSSGSFAGVWINTGSGTFNLADGVAIHLPNVLPASTNALQINGTIYKVINRLGGVNDIAPTTLQGLQNDAKNGIGAAYALGSDIDAAATSGWNAGAGFTPIGDFATDLPFSGIFNGLGHKISNLTINRPSTDYVGLFGYTLGAEISNVGMVGASVRGLDQVGALAGYSDNVVDRSQASGAITGRDNVGGLVGWNEGQISNSSSSANVSGANAVGGLVGWNALDTVSNSRSSGSVSGSGDNVGGLVGQNDAAVVDSQSSASVSGGSAVGGLVGNNLGSVSASRASGPVHGASTVGGLVGLNADTGTIEASQSSSPVSASVDNAGGLVGANEGAITSSQASGLVSGPTAAGGLVGYNGFDGTIDQSQASGAVSGGDSVGGLVGDNQNLITASAASGAVSANNTLGGLVGSNTGSIADGRASGTVNGAGDNVGGLVGDNIGSVTSSLASGQVAGAASVGGLAGVNSGSIRGSFASGNVSGSDNGVGGLVGDNQNLVNDSYASGRVSGADGVGGLVGYNGGDIATSLATGAVSATGLAGGLVGSNDTPGLASVVNSFWNAEVAAVGIGQGEVASASGLSAAQTQQQRHFTGWDFSNTSGAWIQYDGQTAPLLRSFMTPLTVVMNYGSSPSKVYDASTSFNAGSASWLVNGQAGTPDPSLLLGALSSHLASANVGSRTVTPGGYYSTSQFGYQISYTGSTAVLVTPAALGIAAAVDHKVYDGTTLSAATPRVSGLQGGDTVGQVSQAFVSKNALGSSASTLAVATYSVSDGNGGANYSVSTSTAAGTISPAPLSIAAVTDSKVYDGTTLATGTPVVSGLLGGDSLSNAGQAFVVKHALGRNASTLAVSTFAISDGNGGANYAASTATAAGTISPAPLTVFAVADSKVYDGNTASAAVPGVSGLLAGDSLSPNGQVFLSKNVLGSGASTLTASAGAAQDGNGGANYQVSSTTASGTITPAPLTVAATGLARVYDGGADASVTLADNRLAGDLLTFSQTTARFADRHVGNAKPVSVAGIAVAGADAGNYSLQNTSANTSANITPAPLSIAAVTDSKVYDGTTVSTAAPVASGLFGGDSLSNANQAFVVKHALGSNASTLAVSSFAISDGNGGANYAVSMASAAGTISPAPLTVFALADSKVYDASTASAATPGATGLLGSDHLASASQAFASKNVLGNAGSTLAVAGYSLQDGNGGANYSVHTSTAAGTIGQAALAVAAAADRKVYDGTTLSTAAPVASGLLGADSLSSASQAFASKKVLGSKASTLALTSFAINDGNDGANYAVDTSSTAAGTITAAPLQLSGISAQAKTYDGSTAATLSGTALVTALGADRVTVTGSGSGAFADKQVGSGKAVTISGFGLAGTDAGNYAVGQPVAVTASIGPAALSTTGLSAADKVYDGNSRASLIGQAVVNALQGDLVSVAGTAQGSFADQNVGSAKPVSVSGLGLTGADAGNYRLSPAAAGAAAITPAALVYVAAPTTRAVGQTPTDLTGSVQGFAEGDTLANATSGQALWSTPATAASPVGRYGIDGSGLQAPNYRLSQAAGNAEALSVQIGSLPALVNHQLAMLANLIQPQADPEPDRRSITPAAASPMARRQTPLQLVDGGVRLPAGAFNPTP